MKNLQISSIDTFRSYVILTILISFMCSCATIPKLSKSDKKIIKKALKAPISKEVVGETGFAQNGKHTIWYEKIRPDKKALGTVVLIMGNGQDALSWPPRFVSNFTDVGYQVVRFDHRGTGLSTSDEKWKKKKAYSLSDMSEDVIAILDKLAIEKAHLIGVSMGGMIAQIVAIEHPERTASLSSIMSSGHVWDPDLAPMSNAVMPKMISSVLKHGFFGSKRGQIKRQIIQKRILMGSATGEIDVKTIAAVASYNLKKRKGYNLMTARHHYEAILNSESRLEKLAELKIPSLIVHGKADPVMPLSHGEKLAATIPDADQLWITNMGHDLPDSKIDEMTDKIIGLMLVN